MKISNPELKVVRFGADDVIATSGLLGALSGKSGLFYIPAGDYSGGSYSGNYVEFNGTFGNYNGSAYEITDISGEKSAVDSDRDNLVHGGMYFPDTGVTVAMDAINNISKQTYDAFSYGGGYYSYGQSYYDIRNQ